jgi:hypothetical protein
MARASKQHRTPVGRYVLSQSRETNAQMLPSMPVTGVFFVARNYIRSVEFGHMQLTYA